LWEKDKYIEYFSMNPERNRSLWRLRCIREGNIVTDHEETGWENVAELISLKTGTNCGLL
jgi:hypothetical protein